MQTMLLGVIVFQAISVLCQNVNAEFTTVNTTSGAVRGISLTNPSVDVFLGIPFAKPPVGRLRFRLPEPVEPWDGVLDATQFGNACYQQTYPPGSADAAMWNPRANLSEDCLYLNVWVPVPRQMKMPVMVFIHGGSFVSGSTSRTTHDGKRLAAEGNVIVVTIAYRLGVFGFLFLNNESAPGNQGLYDQVMALNWIQTNIGSFGGDPGKVTLFGSSAGSISIHLHLLSPVSQSLFHRAILQSGAFPSAYQFPDETEMTKRGNLLAVDILKCPKSNKSEEILACLVNVSDPTLLVEGQFNVSLDMPFPPMMDGRFVLGSPQTVMEKGKFKKCPLIMGNVADEGTYFVLYGLPQYLNFTYKKMDRTQFEESIKILFKSFLVHSNEKNQKIVDNLISMFGDENKPDDTDTNVAALSKAYGDMLLVCPTLELAQSYSSAGEDTYVYELTTRYTKSPWPSWTGVVHGDDVLFVFGNAPAPEYELTEAERSLSKAIMNYWTNFAKTDNTNQSNLVGTLGTWQTFNSSSDYVHIDLNTRYLDNPQSNANVKTGPRIEECRALWLILAGESVDSTSNGCHRKSWLYATILQSFIISFLKY